MSGLINQILKFGITGVLCFLIDYGLLLFFTENLGVNFLASNIIGFSVSVIVNYFISVRFVFDAKKKNKAYELFVFVILSCIGLGINELCVWQFSNLMSYKLSKIIATGIVMIFNFITRKMFLEKEDAVVRKEENAEYI